jgi:hypothetical protein
VRRELIAQDPKGGAWEFVIDNDTWMVEHVEGVRLHRFPLDMFEEMEDGMALSAPLALAIIRALSGV